MRGSLRRAPIRLFYAMLFCESCVHHKSSIMTFMMHALGKQNKVYTGLSQEMQRQTASMLLPLVSTVVLVTLFSAEEVDGQSCYAQG